MTYSYWYLIFGGKIYQFSIYSLLTVRCISLRLATIRTMATTGKSQFALVHWIEDDQVSVVTTRATVEGYKAEVGTIVKMKWKKEKIPYDVEVLKLSGMVDQHVYLLELPAVANTVAIQYSTGT